MRILYAVFAILGLLGNVWSEDNAVELAMRNYNQAVNEFVSVSAKAGNPVWSGDATRPEYFLVIASMAKAVSAKLQLSTQVQKSQEVSISINKELLNNFLIAEADFQATAQKNIAKEARLP